MLVELNFLRVIKSRLRVIRIIFVFVILYWPRLRLIWKRFSESIRA